MTDISEKGEGEKLEVEYFSVDVEWFRDKRFLCTPLPLDEILVLVKDVVDLCSVVW